MYTFNRPSFWLHFRYQHGARLAQSVEHQTFNLRVKGSSPLLGAHFYLKIYCVALIKIPFALRAFLTLII